MIRLTAFLCLVLLINAPLRAQTMPTTEPAPRIIQYKIQITAVEGLVQYHRNPELKWERAIVGLQLAEGAELRIGPRSRIQFIGNDNKTATFDRLGKLEIHFENGQLDMDQQRRAKYAMRVRDSRVPPTTRPMEAQE